MIKRVMYSLAMLLIGIAGAQAQVVINDVTPSVTLPEGLVLDLQSEDKGLLLPRVPIANLNLWGLAPPAVPGTVVLDENRGVYEWDGTQWLPVVGYNGCGTVVGISGTVYQAGYFGQAGCWMTENLAETEYWDGETINAVAINSTGTDNTVAYISTPGTTAAHLLGTADDAAAVIEARNSNHTFDGGGVGKPGLLYSWVAATRGAALQSEANFTSGAAPSPGIRVQGACPTGWHLPNDYEWNLLEKEIYEHPSAYSSQTTAGTWQDTYETGTNSRPGSGNTDKTYWGHQMKSSQKVTSTVPDGVSNAATANGFNGLMVGYAGSGWVYYGTDAYFWSSSAYTTSNGWYRTLYSGFSGVYRYYYNKYYRFSLRCKKD
jgi:uncharacterized protein (TIGR02145 family)